MLAVSHSSPSHPPTPLPIPPPMAAIAIRLPLALTHLIPSISLDPHLSRRLFHLLVESPLLRSLLCDQTLDTAPAVSKYSGQIDDRASARQRGMEPPRADEVVVRADVHAPAHGVEDDVVSTHCLLGLDV
jgi:hypothetical protein